jgi:hypothetical protein
MTRPLHFYDSETRLFERGGIERGELRRRLRAAGGKAIKKAAVVKTAAF